MADKRPETMVEGDQKSHTMEGTSPLQVRQRSHSISKGAGLVYKSLERWETLLLSIIKALFQRRLRCDQHGPCGNPPELSCFIEEWQEQ